MKKLLSFSFIIILFISCTELKEPTIHQIGWYDNDSENIHVEQIHKNIQFFVDNPDRGKYSDSRWLSALSSCQECHGDPNDRFNFHGGSSGVSCYDCHTGGPSGHPAYDVWVITSDNSEFHGKQVDRSCKVCHTGEGDVVNASCHTCHYEDKIVELSCHTCHYDDKIAELSCSTCHD
jgi:hypothetical protein